MKKYILVLIPLLIFCLTDSAWLQEKPAEPDKDKTDKTEDTDEDLTDEMFKGPISKEEGRKIFESLSKEKKAEIIKRWKELKKLPEEDRKKALDNFYRLFQEEDEENDDDNETPEPPKFSRPEVILSNMLYMSFYNMRRDRTEKHMRLIFAIQKEDPYFFYKMKFLDTQEQRYELLIKTRDKMFEKEINTIAKKINLDDKKTAALKKLLKKQRDEEDKLEVEFVQKQMDLWNEAYNKMTSDEEFYGKVKDFLRIFQFIRMQPPKPEDHGRREMHGQEDGFREKHTVENWKSTIEKLKLSKEKTKKLIDGYNKLYEKYSQSDSDKESRREFKMQLDKLIDETLTKEEKDKLFKLFGPGAFRDGKGPHRERANQK